MSSYANIYLKVKNKELEKPVFVHIDSYSRNSDIYQSIDENGNFFSADGEKKELTNDIFNSILEDLQGQINNCKVYIDTAKELKSPNIDEIVERKEYCKELEDTYKYFDFLHTLLMDKDYNDIEGIYCFID